MTDWLDKYKGIHIADCLQGTARELYLSNREYMHEAFGDNVEYERYDDQILYCEQTRAYLYSPPPKTEYAFGTRPVLEDVVKSVCEGCQTDREKAIALMVYIRDLKKKSNGYDYFYGGTEEELIKKGERYCERVSRLMDALCEIAGIPARTIWHLSGGHLTNEVYIDGNWAYIDPRFGLFYINEHGMMLSVEEIVADPELIFRQPAWVYEYGSDEYPKEYMQQQNYDYYFAKREIQMFSVYSLANSHKYHYDWRPSAVFPMPERDAAYQRFYNARISYFEDKELYSKGVIVL